MNKEKQIEAMAKVLKNNDISMCCFGGCNECSYIKERDNNWFCQPLKLAEALYNAGYRKINENEIVISKEEYERLKTLIHDLREENKELKQDLKKSIDMQKEMLDGFKLSTKEVEENLAREIPNLLKQFAERLKKKIVSMKWAREDTNEKLIKQGATIKAIDKTLKEFLK